MQQAGRTGNPMNTHGHALKIVTGEKRDDPLTPNFVPSIFEHVPIPEKQTVKSRASDYHRKKGAKKGRIEKASRQE